MRTARRLAAFCTVALLALPLEAAENRVALKGYAHPLLRNATKVEHLSSSETVKIGLVIQLDQQLLDQTIDSIYGPGAPAPKHFLSSAEFAQKFGFAEKRKELEDFAAANGLVLDRAANAPESMVVKVSGSAAAVEHAFQVVLNRYRAATDSQIFQAVETPPTVPVSLESKIGLIEGLNTQHGVMRPHLRRRPRSSSDGAVTRALSPSFTGSGQFGGVAPADIQSIYGFTGTAANGQGQIAALVEFDGYEPTDLPGYESNYHLGNIPVVFVSVDGEQNFCGSFQDLTCDGTTALFDDGMVEVALDMDMLAAVAPGLSQMRVYEAENNLLIGVDMYNQIATENIAKSVSTSWGINEQTASSIGIHSSENQIFQRMAAQGQSMFAASGDSGAFDNGVSLSVDDPASQPYVTGVGGTSLSGSVAAPVETAWSGSGGGVSALWTIPSFQRSVAGTASQTMRNVPDVALNADPSSGYSVRVGDHWDIVGGTSAAAPLWAAFAVLINQQSTQTGAPVLGFANQALYFFGTGSSYATTFNDITSGNNGGFNAGAGYDNVTGFGSFKATQLINTATGALALIPLYSLSNVYAYPNPWDIRKKPQNFVTFANVPDGATVKIFTISGFWVKDVVASGGSARWYLDNNGGQSVASGLYLYLVTFDNTSFSFVPSGTHLFKGKVAVIR